MTYANAVAKQTQMFHWLLVCSLPISVSFAQFRMQLHRAYLRWFDVLLLLSVSAVVVLSRERDHATPGPEETVIAAGALPEQDRQVLRLSKKTGTASCWRRGAPAADHIWELLTRYHLSEKVISIWCLLYTLITVCCCWLVLWTRLGVPNSILAPFSVDGLHRWGSLCIGFFGMKP